MTEAESTRPGRPRRISHWDRPPPPRDLRWAVGTVGLSFIVLGLLMLAFVGYQLWGTGIETARAQNSLEGEFEQLLESSPPPATPASKDPPASTAESASTNPATSAPSTSPAPVDQSLPIFEEGDAVARLQIPKIDLDLIMVAGVEREDLKRGPGHYPQTPLPGQLGNAAIAGHRTSYGAPFFNIDQLQAGDEITVTTPAGTFVYVVDDSRIVSPSDTYVLDSDDDGSSRLTLTSCHPRYSASQRIAVSAELARGRSSPVGKPVINHGRPRDDGADDSAIDTIPGEPADPTSTPGAPLDTSTTTPPDTSSAVTAPNTSSVATEPDTGADTTATTEDEVAPTVATGPPDGGGSTGPRSPTAGPEPDAFSDGWFADRGAYPQVAIWGLLLVALAVGGYLVCRRFRNDWSGPVLVAAPFAVTLYFFFQNVNRLLPAAF